MMSLPGRPITMLLCFRVVGPRAGYFYALDDNDGKQKCLDAPSVLARLSGLLLRARKATRVLAAMAAVRGIKGA